MVNSDPPNSHADRQATPISLAFLLLLAGSALSYVGDKNLQLPGYALSLAAICFMLASSYPALTRTTLISTALFLSLACTLWSLSISPLDGALIHAVQAAAYPLVALGLLLTGWRIIVINTSLIYYFLAAVAFINSIVAITSIALPLNSLPIIGEIELGRAIFGTGIPSSPGIFGDVNYYSTAQTTLLFLIAWLAPSNVRRHWWHLVFISLILVSTIIGSSRGALVALAASMVAGSIILWSASAPKLRWRAIIVICCAIPPLLLVAIFASDALYDAFRIARGWNNRDRIWEFGLQFWLERPLLGWGYAGAISEQMYAQVGNASLHNAFFETIVRGGIVLAVINYGLIFSLLFFGIYENRKNIIPLIVPIMIVVFWITRSITQTFSFGGLGLLPVVAVISLSVIVFYRPVIAKRSMVVVNQLSTTRNRSF